MMRVLALLSLVPLLGGCIPQVQHVSRGQQALVDDAQAYNACLVDLAKLGVKVEALPDRTWPNGCSATHAVKLVAIGIPVSNLGAVKCGMAKAFVQWTQQSVQQAAKARIGSYVQKMESYGSFACRPVNNVAGNALSEHGRANAIDIAAFVLANGRRITVKEDWNGPDDKARAFLRDLHAAACRRFNVVLGPDANAYHHDHFHFDMGRGPYCR